MVKKLLFILIGTAAMLILSLLRRKKYRLSLWKAILTPFVLTIFGVLGTLVLFFIETGQWGGVSFYGSVFLIPVGLLLYSWLIKEKYTHVLDFSVTQICAMLACMKISCLIDGCCFGILLFQNTNGQMIRFPSQIIEMMASVCIMLIFLYFENEDLFKSKYYPMYFIIYGSVRFILNFFRGGLTPFVWILPAGHFWSIVAIVIGLIWLTLAQKQMNKTEEDPPLPRNNSRKSSEFSDF